MRGPSRSWLKSSVLFLALVLNCGVRCSDGDELPHFQACLAHCEQDALAADASAKSNTCQQLPLSLRVLGWTPVDDCKYTCARTIAHKFPKTQYKFYGKWHFKRVFGLQEIASVVFSLANLVAHVVGWRKVALKYPSAKQASKSTCKYYFMWPWYKLYYVSSVATWIFSIVFHARDVRITELLDYFGAAWSIFVFLMCGAIQSFNVESLRAQRTIRNVFSCIFVAHVGKMFFHVFDYTFNMCVMVVAALISQFLWFWWWLRFSPPNFGWTIPKTVSLCLCAGFFFELLDFPPIGELVDAHALWHASTVFVVKWWYDVFLKTLEIAPEKNDF